MNAERELIEAAKKGHVERVRLLMTASGPLGEIDGLLDPVIKGGHAKVAAALIGAEPRLLDAVDLSECLAAASKRGHHDLAAYVSSIIDQKEILATVPELTARASASARI